MQEGQRSKSLLRYPGGKSYAISALMPYFPTDITEMVSPFFGGGSLEWECASRGITVHGYDIFEPLVNFWQHVLNHKEKLHARILEFPIPLPKEEFYRIQKEYDNLENRLEKAAHFYLLNRTSFSGTTFSGGMSPSQKNWNPRCIEKLKKFSLGGLFGSSGEVTVGCEDFSVSMEKHKDIFAYMDPPYLLDNSTLYGDRGSTHKDFDHMQFYNSVKGMNEKWAVSYNDHPELLELYKDYNIHTPTWRYSMKSKGGCKESYEILITNY